MSFLPRSRSRWTARSTDGVHQREVSCARGLSPHHKFFDLFSPCAPGQHSGHPWFGVRASRYPVHSGRRPHPLLSVSDAPVLEHHSLRLGLWLSLPWLPPFQSPVALRYPNANQLSITSRLCHLSTSVRWTMSISVLCEFRAREAFCVCESRVHRAFSSCVLKQGELGAPPRRLTCVCLSGPSPIT